MHHYLYSKGTNECLHKGRNGRNVLPCAAQHHPSVASPTCWKPQASLDPTLCLLLLVGRVSLQPLPDIHRGKCGQKNDVVHCHTASSLCMRLLMASSVPLVRGQTSGHQAQHSSLNVTSHSWSHCPGFQKELGGWCKERQTSQIFAPHSVMSRTSVSPALCCPDDNDERACHPPHPHSSHEQLWSPSLTSMMSWPMGQPLLQIWVGG